MPSIRKKIAELFRARIPTGRITRLDVRALPAEVATTVDVDRVAQILRAAIDGDLSGLFALYRDIVSTHSHLQGRFVERKEAVVGDTLNIQPWDKKKADDVTAADAIREQIADLDSWEGACIHLLDSTLYPVALLEKVFRPNEAGTAYELAELVPVPHDLLDFRYGRLQIRVTDDRGRPSGEVFDPDPARYIIHRGHLLTQPDQWGGPLRSLVFWWLLGTMDREWWGRFLDRYGAPFLVGSYDQGDDESRSVLERAFSFCTKLGGLVVTRETQVDLKEAARSDAGTAFETFHRVCNEEISKLILGQTLSSDAKGTGMGSGVAKSQDGVRQDKRQSDARRLGATLRTQLFRQLLAINGLKGQAPKAIWGAVSTEEMSATGDVLDKLSNAGLEVADSGLEVLSERFGLPIQRKAAPVADPSGFLTHNLRLHTAPGRLDRVEMANAGVARGAAAELVRQFGKDHAPIVQIALTSRSADEFLTKLEQHCAGLDPLKAAEIVEAGLNACLANGAVVHAQR